MSYICLVIPSYILHVTTNWLSPTQGCSVALQFCCLFWWGAPPGWLSEDPAGSLESSRPRPHGLAWLEPSWCDTIVSQAWVCLCRSVGALACESACACLYVCTHGDAFTHLHMHTGECVRTRLCVCVCLLPSAPSNRLIFHISHGQEGQEAARLRPEPGYSTVSSARHSLAPPKLSALLPNALASFHALAPCSLLLSPQ